MRIISITIRILISIFFLMISYLLFDSAFQRDYITSFIWKDYAFMSGGIIVFFFVTHHIHIILKEFHLGTKHGKMFFLMAIPFVFALIGYLGMIGYDLISHFQWNLFFVFLISVLLITLHLYDYLKLFNRNDLHKEEILDL